MKNIIRIQKIKLFPFPKMITTYARNQAVFNKYYLYTAPFFMTKPITLHPSPTVCFIPQFAFFKQVQAVQSVKKIMINSWMDIVVKTFIDNCMREE